MKSIWKYPLQVTDEQVIDAPEGAEALTVQMQSGTPCLWMRVDPASPKMPRKIITHGTGHRVQDTTGRYIGTYQLDGGALVFHVFDAA
jgi:hypothetical protein